MGPYTWLELKIGIRLVSFVFLLVCLFVFVFNVSNPQVEEVEVQKSSLTKVTDNYLAELRGGKKGGAGKFKVVSPSKQKIKLKFK